MYNMHIKATQKITNKTVFSVYQKCAIMIQKFHSSFECSQSNELEKGSTPYVSVNVNIYMYNIHVYLPKIRHIHVKYAYTFQ